MPSAAGLLSSFKTSWDHQLMRCHTSQRGARGRRALACLIFMFNAKRDLLATKLTRQGSRCSGAQRRYKSSGLPRFRQYRQVDLGCYPGDCRGGGIDHGGQEKSNPVGRGQFLSDAGLDQASADVFNPGSPEGITGWHPSRLVGNHTLAKCPNGGPPSIKSTVILDK